MAPRISWNLRQIYSILTSTENGQSSIWAHVFGFVTLACRACDDASKNNDRTVLERKKGSNTTATELVRNELMIALR